MMTEEMKRKIDIVLERVKEPETYRSVKELGLVGNISYSESEKKLKVILDIEEPRLSCFVCGVVTATIRRSLMRDLKEEFEKEFPTLAVEVI
jgi:metal-sulfur cluster biosynthetic enzyme